MKTNGIAVLLITSLFFAAAALARPLHRYDYTTKSCRSFGEGQLEWDSRPWGVGGKVFRQLCKKCHFRGNEAGASFLQVESKTSKGWNRVFAERKVACARDGAWDGLTMDQQLKLNDYLYRFAFGTMDIYDEV